ncbi:hypothetical protein I4U23_029727 [Adineta vaga]|nr:hypothetical protein I4U23_029727 [Adineta vaga]
MYSSISKLDRDIARAFLNAPSNSILYLPMLMANKPNEKMIESSPYIYTKENSFDNILPPPHPNAQLGYPTNQNIIPMYYDVIIDTVTDYDIFYPIAKQTEKHYYDSTNSQQTISNDNSTQSRYHVQRLDELAVSIDFPHDYEPTSQCSNDSIQNQNERLYAIKNSRFHEHPGISSANSTIGKYVTPSDQYYFYPDTVSKMDNEQSATRYISAPLFWFRPVVDQNHAICIPTSRPSLHAYVTPLFDSHPTSNPVRL